MSLLHCEDFQKGFCFCFCFSITSMEPFFKPLYWKVGQQREYKLINPSVCVRMFLFIHTLSQSNPKIKCEAFGSQMLRTLNTMIQKCKTLILKNIASDEWPHRSEIILNNCKGTKSFHMGK